MGVSMAAFTTFIEQFSDVLWNSLLLFLLVGTGVYFTVRLRGVQVRRFGEGFRRVFGGFTLRGKKADAEGMSSFQALTTAIAAQVGTGNITGCAAGSDRKCLSGRCRCLGKDLACYAANGIPADILRSVLEYCDLFPQLCTDQIADRRWTCQCNQEPYLLYLRKCDY